MRGPAHELVGRGVVGVRGRCRVSVLYDLDPAHDELRALERWGVELVHGHDGLQHVAQHLVFVNRAISIRDACRSQPVRMMSDWREPSITIRPQHPIRSARPLKHDATLRLVDDLHVHGLTAWAAARPLLVETHGQHA
eukprot:9111136-Pyramimonas_sp.AAC.1